MFPSTCIIDSKGKLRVRKDFSPTEAHSLDPVIGTPFTKASKGETIKLSSALEAREGKASDGDNNHNDLGKRRIL